MASGLIHLTITMAIALSFAVGGILPDIDHAKIFGGSHTTKQLWKGFLGFEFKDGARQDSDHLFHKASTYRAVFIGVGIMLALALGYFSHLKLDNII